MQVEFSIVLGDIMVYFIALFYAVIILTIADIARKKRNLGSEVTRRIVHLFAGAAIWTVPFYPHPWVATLVALTFVIMLGLANTERFSGFFAAMARPEDLDNNSVRGPFWYAVSITILTGIFTFTGFHEIYFIVFVTGGNILWFEMIVLALMGAITATLVEFVSPKGTDNTTLPLISCVVMFLVAMQLGLIFI